MGIRPDDVQYIELYNEYNKLHTNGEKVSYIVATLSLDRKSVPYDMASVNERYMT